MGNIFLFFYFLFFVIPLYASASRPPKQIADTPAVLSESRELAFAINRFGFKVFQELGNKASKDNLFISPYSIATALGMTYNGAKGTTQAVMGKVLEVSDIPIPRLNSSALGLKNLLAVTPNGEILIANSLWARKGIVFNPEFIKTNQQFYQAEVANLDFFSPEAPLRINNWVKEKTKGKITKIIDRIKPEAVLFLINAVYFKGRWQKEFDPKQTQEQEFKLLNGAKKR